MRTHVPRHPDTVALLHRCTVSIPSAMCERIHDLALDAGSLLDCTVSHAALFRAALLPWIDKAERSSLVNTHEEIRRAGPPYGTLLQRCKPAFPTEHEAQRERGAAEHRGALDSRLTASQRCGLRSALERGATWTPRTAGRTRPPAARRAWGERRREPLGAS